MKSNLISWGGTVVGEVLSYQLFPGSGLGTKLIDAHLAKRRAEATEILIGEISSGFHGTVEFDESDIDPLIDVVLRFAKAVSDGAAKENLRLLAQVIAGLKKNRALTGDRFRRWANVLEALTRDEILLIGKACKIPFQPGVNKDEFAEALGKAMMEAGYPYEEYRAVVTSVSRFGIFTMNRNRRTAATIFFPTPWLQDIAKLVDTDMMATVKP